ncbi:MAG: 5'-3' exonuclease H3TH domain-containing protein, partial [Candidatus Bathyarchaeia archaeon]
MSKKPRLFLIDGSSYIYRAFFAIRVLSTSRGFPTNAVFGFTSMLMSVIRNHSPEYMAICFDAKGPTFRHEMYDQYKANRPEMPEDLAPQIPYIKAIVDGFRIPVFEKEGYEADDLIGTIVRNLNREEIEVVIVSGDKDLFQLIDERVTALDTMKNRSLDSRGIEELYGVKPNQMTDIMALMGDSIDNIPGVPGIGEKKAAKLIREFGSLENLLQNLEKVEEKRAREALIAYGDQARLSKGLATINCNVPIEVNLEDFRLPQPDTEALRRIFKELEFTKFISELPPPSRRLPSDAYRTVLKKEEFLRLKEAIEEAGRFAIDLETTSREPMRAKIIGIAISFRPHEAYYIPIGHVYDGAPGQLDGKWVLEELRSILENEGILKIGQNIKYE